MQAGESSAQGLRRSMEDETVLLMNLNAVLESDPHAHPRVRFWVAAVVATADSFSPLSAAIDVYATEPDCRRAS